MRFQNALAALNGIVPAMIRWIVHQMNAQSRVISELELTFDELPSPTLHMGTVIRIYDLLRNMREPGQVVFPPSFETICDLVTGLDRRTVKDGHTRMVRLRNSHGHELFIRLKIMIRSRLGIG